MKKGLSGKIICLEAEIAGKTQSTRFARGAGSSGAIGKIFNEKAEAP